MMICIQCGREFDEKEGYSARFATYENPSRPNGTSCLKCSMAEFAKDVGDACDAFLNMTDGEERWERQVKKKKCVWISEIDMDAFSTDCGHSFWFEDGTAKENGFKFCPYCGKELEEDLRDSICDECGEHNFSNDICGDCSCCSGCCECDEEVR